MFPLLTDQLPAASEGMIRVIQCFVGTNLIPDSTIVTMLPEEVTIVCREEAYTSSPEYSEYESDYS